MEEAWVHHQLRTAFQRQRESQLHDLLLQTLVPNRPVNLLDVGIHKSRLGCQHLEDAENYWFES